MKKTLRILATSALLSFGAISVTSCGTSDTNIVDNNQQKSLILLGEQTLKVGETLTLKPRLSYEETNPSFKWLSLNPDVATVSNGEVTALKEGETTIVCHLETDANIKSEVNITVLGSPEEANILEVRFLNYDGTLLEKQLIEKGETPSYHGATPTRIGDTMFSYAFIGWDKELGPVQNNTDYIAVFDEIPYTDFTFAVDVVNKGFQVVAYSGTKTELEIPQTFAYRNIVSIAKDAFKGNKTIEKITLPQTVVAIGDSAFEGCDALTTINIPNNFKTFGKRSFYNCKKLSGILEIGDQVTEIPDECFYGCENLNSLNGHKNLEKIGNSAFCNARVLDFKFNYGLKWIGAFAFQSNKVLYHVELPDSVTYLGQSVFCHAIGIYSLKLPKNLEEISYLYSGGEEGYQSLVLGCTNLLTVTIDESNEKFKVIDNCLYSKDGTIFYFAPATRFGDLVVEDGVKEIKGAACYKTQGTNLVLPKTLETVGQWAFYESSFTSLTIEDGEPRNFHLGSEAFVDCKLLKTVSLGEGLQSLGNSTFKGCFNLTSVSLPSTLTKLADSVFKDCTSLVDVNIPDSCVAIGQSCFANTAIKTLHIPEGVKELSYAVLDGCTNVTEVKLPSTIEKIGAFSISETQITSLVIPDSVTSIAASAFAYNPKLKEVVISRNIPSLLANVFNECNAIETITFGKEVLPEEVSKFKFSIATNTFKGCNLIKTINFRGSQEAFSKVTISDTALKNKIASGEITVNYNYVDPEVK